MQYLKHYWYIPPIIPAYNALDALTTTLHDWVICGGKCCEGCIATASWACESVRKKRKYWLFALVDLPQQKCSKIRMREDLKLRAPIGVLRVMGICSSVFFSCRSECAQTDLYYTRGLCMCTHRFVFTNTDERWRRKPIFSVANCAPFDCPYQVALKLKKVAEFWVVQFEVTKQLSLCANFCLCGGARVCAMVFPTLAMVSWNLNSGSRVSGNSGENWASDRKLVAYIGSEEDSIKKLMNGGSSKQMVQRWNKQTN